MKLYRQDKIGLFWVAVILLALVWIGVNAKYGILS